jgi:hypothetical protein
MWVKGNIHCHTIASDGDSEPSAVCRIYAEHGYDFLSITDHMRRVDPSQVDNPHGLLLIPGEELQTRGEDVPAAPLHLNGIGVTKRLECEPAATRERAIQDCIDLITADGAIAQINHPNWHYAFDHTTMLRTNGALLLEVFNGHPAVNNLGDESHISVEAMWDHLLSAGMVIYATAVDDSHHFREFAPHRANPLRGWVCARVEQLTESEVLCALRKGEFYASTGVVLEDVRLEREAVEVAIRPQSGLTYVTSLIGDGGEVLSESTLSEARLGVPSDRPLTYVRAKVTASDGTCAWTQPAFRQGA